MGGRGKENRCFEIEEIPPGEDAYNRLATAAAGTGVVVVLPERGRGGNKIVDIEFPSQTKRNRFFGKLGKLLSS